MGLLLESFNARAFEAAIGKHVSFVQDNHSCSSKNVLRGLHYQIRQPQGKLVRVIAGIVFDVAVDLRKGSPTFGRWVGDVLSAENRKQIWVLEGVCPRICRDVGACRSPVQNYGLLVTGKRTLHHLERRDPGDQVAHRWSTDNFLKRCTRSDNAGCGSFCLTNCPKSCRFSARQ